MEISLSRLRQNIYRIFDEVLKTGKPLVIHRKGGIIRIVPDRQNPPAGKLAALQPHPDVLNCESEELIHMDWSQEWQGKDDV